MEKGRVVKDRGIGGNQSLGSPPQRGAVASVPVVSWRADPKTFRLTSVSGSAFGFLGIPAEEWTAHPTFWADHIHPEDRDGALEFCARAVPQGKPYEFEYRMLHASGGTVWVWNAVHVVTDQARPVELLGVMVDITERKKSEAQLRRSEEYWREIVAQAADCIMVIDSEGKILHMNRTVDGLAVGEVLGRTVFDYVTPESRERLRQYVLQVFETGEPLRYEIEGAGPDGETAWYSTQLTPVRREGQVVAATVIARDVTARKNAVDTLRETEADQRALLQALPDRIFRIHRDGTFLDFKEAGGQVPAVPPRDFLGRKISDVFPETFPSTVLKLVEKALENGRTQTFSYQQAVPFPLGEKTDFEARIVPSGKNDVLAIIRNLTQSGLMPRQGSAASS